MEASIKKGMMYTVLVIVAIALLVTLEKSYLIVPQGSVAVLYNIYSDSPSVQGNETEQELKKDKSSLRVTGQGFQMFTPFVTGWQEFPLTAQTIRLEGEVRAKNGDDEEVDGPRVVFKDKGSLPIYADTVVRYHIDSSSPRGISNLFLMYRQGLGGTEGIENRYLIPILRDTITKEGTAYNAEELNSEKRTEFQIRVATAFQNRLNGTSIIIDDVLFPSAVELPTYIQAAIENKTKARQILEQLEQETLQEKEKAERKRIEAEGELVKVKLDADANAYSITTTAGAQAKANQLLRESITPELVHLKEIEKWDGKLPVYMLGNSTTMMLSK